MFLAFLILTLASLASITTGKVPVPHRPPHKLYNEAARFVIAKGSYGVLATGGDSSNKDISSDASQVIPFGNIVSYSDGVYTDSEWKSTGTPVFFLPILDVTAQDLAVNKWASLTVSDAMSGPCLMDAMDPTCWRVTLTGPVEKLEGDAAKAAKAKFKSKHPEMAFWPTDHGFAFYSLDVKKIFLLDFYGGPHKFKLEEYFQADVTPAKAAGLEALSLRGSP